MKRNKKAQKLFEEACERSSERWGMVLEAFKKEGMTGMKKQILALNKH